VPGKLFACRPMVAKPALKNRLLEVKVASSDTLDIRHFEARERMNALFEITLVAVSENMAGA
jgi:uncharacterized protein involved in type VI secretion and phage assembly